MSNNKQIKVGQIRRCSSDGIFIILEQKAPDWFCVVYWVNSKVTKIETKGFIKGYSTLISIMPESRVRELYG